MKVSWQRVSTSWIRASGVCTSAPEYYTDVFSAGRRWSQVERWHNAPSGRRFFTFSSARVGVT